MVINHHITLSVLAWCTLHGFENRYEFESSMSNQSKNDYLIGLYFASIVDIAKNGIKWHEYWYLCYQCSASTKWGFGC